MSKAFTIPSIFTAIDKFTAPMEKMTRAMGAFGHEGDTAAARIDRRFRKLGDAAANVAKKSLIAGAAIVAPLALAANEAVKFEDKMADVGKTTGLQGAELVDFGDKVLEMSSKTRTGIDDLVKIAEIGGQLGIAKKDLLSFTEASNKFNVAIGADFSGGVEEAISAVGKIKTLFKDTKSLNISDSISRTGSAINELGAVGAATSANMSDFILRLGALPDALKPSLVNTAALGAYLEEVGIDAQIGAGGVTNFLLVAGKSVDKFATQMGLSALEAKALLAQDPTEFAKKFSQSLNGLAPDKLAKKLDDLKLNSQETIKVIGALGTGTARLTELQNISSGAFAKGTSLQDEYNKKNSTTAANLAKAQNNFKALTILIGTQLLPIISELVEKIVPVIRSTMDWVKTHKTLTKWILIIAGAIGAFLLIVSGIASVVSAVSMAIAGLTTFTAGLSAAFVWLNAVMYANPIGLIVAVTIVIIKYWNEFGAVLAMMLGPFGLLISLVQSFRRNWDMITESFREGGFLAGLKAIGVTIMDSVLMPLQQVLKIISNLTGFEWAASAEKDLEKFRADMGVNVTTDESGKPLLDPKKTEQEALVSKLETTQRQKVAIDINDNSGRATVQSDNNLVPIHLTSTR